MSLTAGTASQVSVSSNSDVVTVAAATGGTGPYTYQWYRSTTTGFSPGGGTLISGATTLTYSDSGLIPNTIYYYVNRVTDTGNSNVTADSVQLAVTTTPQQLSQNSFGQVAIGGQLDLPYNTSTVAAQVDVSQSGTLYAAQAVKRVDVGSGVPKVVSCTAASDEVYGWLNYDIKNVGYKAGDMVEISQSGNVMFLYAVAAIAAGAQVQLDVVSPGSVKTITGSSGANLVGYAIDKATNPGDLIRVKLSAPSYAFA